MATKHYFRGAKVDFKVPNQSLGEFLLERMQNTPQDNLFQINGKTNQEVTFGQFLSRSIQLAQGLRLRGFGKGDVVVTMGKLSYNLYTATIGATLQNTPLFPLDTSCKQYELEQLFQATEPKIVFADNESSFYVTAALNALKNRAEVVLLDSEPEPGERLRSFEEFLEPCASDSFVPEGVDDPSQETIAILASSGTTGVRKAVQLTHINGIYQILICGGIQPAKDKLRYLLGTPTFWITGYLFFMSSCGLGYSHVYIPEFHAETVLSSIEKYKPRWTFINPTSLRLLIDDSSFSNYDVSSLNIVTVGGSALSDGFIKLVEEKWPKKDRIFQQVYGASELTGCISEPISRAPPRSAGQIIRGTIGKVIDTKTGEHFGPNALGELFFKSENGVMKGYVNRPEESANAFDDEGFYQTGDAGYITEDNFIYIAGRVKDLIKFKGHQVSPIELENEISKISGVKEVAVVGRPHDVDGYHAVAAVVKDPQSSLTEECIVKYVADNMPKNKQLTGGVIFVEAIPNNSNGKIVRERVRKLLGIE